HWRQSRSGCFATVCRARGPSDLATARAVFGFLPPKEVTIMAYTLPPLPYPPNALEPHIDAKTMEIHHGKHHNAYVTNLNNAIQGTDLGNQTIESLVANINLVPEN